jgi:hypothetical protein
MKVLALGRWDFQDVIFLGGLRLGGAVFLVKYYKKVNYLIKHIN